MVCSVTRNSSAVVAKHLKKKRQTNDRAVRYRDYRDTVAERGAAPSCNVLCGSAARVCYRRVTIIVDSKAFIFTLV